jgi:PAS domain S-box-containing protein
MEDGSYKIPYISERVAEFWGVPAYKVIENADEGWKRVVPEDIEPAKASIDNAVETFTEWNHIMRFYDKDNTIRYLRGIGSPFKMGDGTVEFITVFIDVTDQVLAEQIIIEKQTQLKNVTDQLPGVVFKYSLSTNGTERILYLSDGVETTFGINKTDALHDVNVVWNLFHEEDLEGLKDSMFASAQTLEKWEYRFRFYSQDGKIRYLQGYGTPKKQSNGTVVWDAILLDITDRVDAETRAQTWNKKLRSFINSSPIAIYQIDPNGIVNDFWNPTASVIFGWQKHEVLGNKLPHVRDDQKDEMVKIIEDIRITGKPKQFEVKRFNRFNEELVLEVTAGPFFDENGTLTDLLIIANDVTELTEYRESLEKALREKEILLQEIHHRVKNNLAIVSGLLELQMMRDDYNADNGIIVEARNRIHSIAMVHEQLYQDMDFSHIDPSEYYRKLLSKLQRNTISDDRDIEYDLKFDIDRININRAVPLGLLINELFTNSIKYAFVDGKGKLKLHFQQVGNQISVHYEDDGPGFTIDEVKQKNTIGWQLIETLLLQLDSEYTMDTNGKFQLIFTFEEAIKGSQSHYT